MKKSILFNFLIFTQFFVLSSFNNVANGQVGPSVWQNQSQSFLIINTVSPEGKLTGHYINNNSEFNCVGTPYPLTGWVLSNTNTITFTVKYSNAYENCQSISSWTGFLGSSNRTITTLWQLVANGTTSTGQIIQGTDSFRRVDSQTHASLLKKDVYQTVKKKNKK